MSSKNCMSLDKETALLCTNLGKCYQIYESPAARLKQALWRGKRQFFREFWALRDASLEVKRGESLGIIGRNGSGKSTLLQLIAGTLNPTEGTIQTQGRIAALLELGSGFNPEFTGLENVYLNATMLGLSKESTDAKIDDILSFAEIGEFVRQPVKTYSSGMTVRLAFAVATALDPDILIVDEALSVGDSFFTSKCRKKMIGLRDMGATMIVVSHDLEQLAALCDTGLIVSNGQISAAGPLRRQIHDYLAGSHLCIRSSEHAQNDQTVTPTHDQSSNDYNHNISEGNGDSANVNRFLISEIQINNRRIPVGFLAEKQKIGPASSGCQITFVLNTDKLSSLICRHYSIGILIQDANGQTIWSACKLIELTATSSENMESLRITIYWPPLRNGTYFIVAGIGIPNSIDPHDNIPIVWDAERISIESTGQSSFSTALLNGEFQ